MATYETPFANRLRTQIERNFPDRGSADAGSDDAIPPLRSPDANHAAWLYFQEQWTRDGSSMASTFEEASYEALDMVLEEEEMLCSFTQLVDRNRILERVPRWAAFIAVWMLSDMLCKDDLPYIDPVRSTYFDYNEADEAALVMATEDCLDEWPGMRVAVQTMLGKLRLVAVRTEASHSSKAVASDPACAFNDNDRFAHQFWIHNDWPGRHDDDDDDDDDDGERGSEDRADAVAGSSAATGLRATPVAFANAPCVGAEEPCVAELETRLVALLREHRKGGVKWCIFANPFVIRRGSGANKTANRVVTGIDRNRKNTDTFVTDPTTLRQESKPLPGWRPGEVRLRTLESVLAELRMLADVLRLVAYGKTLRKDTTPDNIPLCLAHHVAIVVGACDNEVERLLLLLFYYLKMYSPGDKNKRESKLATPPKHRRRSSTKPITDPFAPWSVARLLRIEKECAQEGKPWRFHGVDKLSLPSVVANTGIPAAFWNACTWRSNLQNSSADNPSLPRRRMGLNNVLPGKTASTGGAGGTYYAALDKYSQSRGLKPNENKAALYATACGVRDAGLALRNDLGCVQFETPAEGAERCVQTDEPVPVLLGLPTQFRRAKAVGATEGLDGVLLIGGSVDAYLKAIASIIALCSDSGAIGMTLDDLRSRTDGRYFPDLRTDPNPALPTSLNPDGTDNPEGIGGDGYKECFGGSSDDVTASPRNPRWVNWGERVNPATETTVYAPLSRPVGGFLCEGELPEYPTDGKSEKDRHAELWELVFEESALEYTDAARARYPDSYPPPTTASTAARRAEIDARKEAIIVVLNRERYLAMLDELIRNDAMYNEMLAPLRFDADGCAVKPLSALARAHLAIKKACSGKCVSDNVVKAITEDAQLGEFQLTASDREMLEREFEEPARVEAALQLARKQITHKHIQLCERRCREFFHFVQIDAKCRFFLRVQEELSTRIEALSEIRCQLQAALATARDASKAKRQLAVELHRVQARLGTLQEEHGWVTDEFLGQGMMGNRNNRNCTVSDANGNLHHAPPRGLYFERAKAREKMKPLSHSAQKSDSTRVTTVRRAPRANLVEGQIREGDRTFRDVMQTRKRIGEPGYAKAYVDEYECARRAHRQNHFAVGNHAGAIYNASIRQMLQQVAGRLTRFMSGMDLGGGKYLLDNRDARLKFQGYHKKTLDGTHQRRLLSAQREGALKVYKLVDRPLCEQGGIYRLAPNDVQGDRGEHARCLSSARREEGRRLAKAYFRNVQSRAGLYELDLYALYDASSRHREVFAMLYGTLQAAEELLSWEWLHYDAPVVGLANQEKELAHEWATNTTPTREMALARAHAQGRRDVQIADVARPTLPVVGALRCMRMYAHERTKAIFFHLLKQYRAGVKHADVVVMELNEALHRIQLTPAQRRVFIDFKEDIELEQNRRWYLESTNKRAKELFRLYDEWKDEDARKGGYDDDAMSDEMCAERDDDTRLIVGNRINYECLTSLRRDIESDMMQRGDEPFPKDPPVGHKRTHAQITLNLKDLLAVMDEVRSPQKAQLFRAWHRGSYPNYGELFVKAFDRPSSYWDDDPTDEHHTDRTHPLYCTPDTVELRRQANEVAARIEALDASHCDLDDGERAALDREKTELRRLYKRIDALVEEDADRYSDKYARAPECTYVEPQIASWQLYEMLLRDQIDGLATEETGGCGAGARVKMTLAGVRWDRAHVPTWGSEADMQSEPKRRRNNYRDPVPMFDVDCNADDDAYCAEIDRDVQEGGAPQSLALREEAFRQSSEFGPAVLSGGAGGYDEPRVDETECSERLFEWPTCNETHTEKAKAVVVPSRARIPSLSSAQQALVRAHEVAARAASQRSDRPPPNSQIPIQKWRMLPDEVKQDVQRDPTSAGVAWEGRPRGNGAWRGLPETQLQVAADGSVIDMGAARKDGRMMVWALPPELRKLGFRHADGPEWYPDNGGRWVNLDTDKYTVDPTGRVHAIVERASRSSRPPPFLPHNAERFAALCDEGQIWWDAERHAWKWDSRMDGRLRIEEGTRRLRWVDALEEHKDRAEYRNALIVDERQDEAAMVDVDGAFD